MDLSNNNDECLRYVKMLSLKETVNIIAMSLYNVYDEHKSRRILLYWQMAGKAVYISIILNIVYFMYQWTNIHSRSIGVKNKAHMLCRCTHIHVGRLLPGALLPLAGQE